MTESPRYGVTASRSYFILMCVSLVAVWITEPYQIAKVAHSKLQHLANTDESIKPAEAKDVPFAIENAGQTPIPK